MHEDFNKKHYPFVAAFKRNNEAVKYVPGCTTIGEYLCKLESSKIKGVWVNNFRPLWNAKGMSEADKKNISGIMGIGSVLGTDLEKHLVKFGKQETYWTWNNDASEKKKLEKDKTVYTHVSKSDPYDDEGEIRISKKNYPKEVQSIIENNCSTQKNYYEINKYSSLLADLETIGWKLK